MRIKHLPDPYPFWEYVRIGPTIYRVVFRIFNWHVLIPT